MFLLLKWVRTLVQYFLFSCPFCSKNGFGVSQWPDRLCSIQVEKIKSCHLSIPSALSYHFRVDESYVKWTVVNFLSASSSSVSVNSSLHLSSVYSCDQTWVSAGRKFSIFSTVVLSNFTFSVIQFQSKCTFADTEKILLRTAVFACFCFEESLVN